MHINYPLYVVASHLLLPVALTRLLIKSRNSPPYRERLGERFGYYRQPRCQKPIWIHTVSVGEFNAARPLITRLQERYPQIPLLVTTTTPTGSAEVRRFSTNLDHCYLPYDLPWVVNRFLRHFKPRLAIIFETELWPTLFRRCQHADIPIIIGNARLSDRSMRGYSRFQPLIRETLRIPSRIAAATDETAQRLQTLGAIPDRTSRVGNTKFDYQPEQEIPEQANRLRDQVLGKNRPVWIAASTHEGEEEQLIRAHMGLLQEKPDALLIVVPRHPERFDRVAGLCSDYLSTVRRSSGIQCSDETKIYLGDSMGELPLLYAAADIAFIGGSLQPVGGHNPIEPAAFSKPVLFGPHVDNFREITALLLNTEAALQIENRQQLVSQLLLLLNDSQTAKKMGAAGSRLVANHRGASNRLMALISETLAKQSSGYL